MYTCTYRAYNNITLLQKTVGTYIITIYNNSNNNTKHITFADGYEHRVRSAQNGWVEDDGKKKKTGGKKCSRPRCRRAIIKGAAIFPRTAVGSERRVPVSRRGGGPVPRRSLPGAAAAGSVHATAAANRGRGRRGLPAALPVGYAKEPRRRSGRR